MLILHLPLTGDIHNQGLLEEETYITQDLTYSDNGKLGKCLQFNGDPKQILSFVNIPKKKNNFTWACWIKQTNRTSTVYQKTTQYVLSMGRDCGAIGFNIRMINGYLNIHLGSGEDTDTTTSITNKGINIQELQLNIWYHICCIVDNESVNVYINGELVKTFLLVDISYRSNSHGYFTIGKMGYNNYNTSAYFPFNGLIQDVRVYDTAISPRQVKEISKGLICHYPLGEIDGKIGGRNLYRGTKDFLGEYDYWTSAYSTYPTKTGYSKQGWVKETETYNGFTVLSKTATWNGLRQYIPTESGQQYTLSGYVKVNSTTNVYIFADTQLLVKQISPDMGWVRIYATYIAKQEYSNIRIEHGDSNVTLSICGLKFEKGNKATPWTPALEDDASFYDNVIYDTSGYCNNGSVTDSTCPTWSSDTPRYKGSYYFDLDKRIIINDLQYENIKYGTISIWINCHLTSSSWRTYLFLANAFNWTGNEYDFIILGSTGGQDVTIDCCSHAHPYSVELNKWYMFTITWDLESHISNYYVNGQKIKTYNDDKINITYASKHNSHFLGSNNATYEQDYSLSDFRIYATTLSDSDILELYQSSASVDNNGNLMVVGEVIEE